MTSERDRSQATTSAALQPALDVLSGRGHAVVGLDLAGRIVFWNQRAASLSGWAPATATGRLLYDLLVGRSRLEVVDGLAALSEGLSWQAAVDLEGPRGRTLRVEVSLEPVLRDGAVEGGAGVLRVLSREAQERRLHELSVALRTVPDAVLVIDHELHVTEWNPAAEELFGWSRVAMLGLSVTDLVPERDRAAFERMWGDLVAGQVPAPYETTITDRQGGPRMLTVHAAGYRERGEFAGAVATIHELSERQQDDRVLAGLVASIPVVVAAYDQQARVTLAAGAGCTLPEVAAWAEVGSDLLQALPTGSDLRSAVVDSLHGAASSLQVTFDQRVWQCHVAPAEGGGTLSAVDITAEQVLDDRLQAVFAAGYLGFVVFDAGGRATYAAGSVLEDQGIDVFDIVGVPLLEAYGHEEELAEALLRCLAGQAVDLVTERRSRVLEVHLRSYRDPSGRVTGGVCLIQDATAWAGGDAPRLPDLALERDELTGLLRRDGLQRLVAEPLERGVSRAVAVLDVEAHSLVGETHGVDSARLVMQVLAGRLVRHCRPASVGRWAEDAFAIVLDAADARAELAALLDEALAALALPVELPTGRLHLSASVGAAVSDQVPTPDLLEAAERALQRARAEGRLDVCWHSREMRPVRGGPRLLRQLGEALTNDELRVHYQPIVAIDTRETTALEALVRWEHPTEGLLLPDAFVPAAERSGLVHDLGRWVATAACRQAVALADAGTPLKVAVNVAARQLTEPALVEMLTEVTGDLGCPPGSLSIEVTETALMADLDAAVATLEQLKELGVELALDDFGTGYSSLLYLRRFPVDCLKIDRSFVAGLGVSPEDTAIVASTISLGHSVGVRCVAEGVETLAQLELLRSMGCDFAQGYLFSRALPGDQLTSWLAEQSVPSPRRGMWTDAPPPEADEILQMHAEGASLHTIAAALNVAGRRTARGTRWQARTVATVVAKWAYPTWGRDD